MVVQQSLLNQPTIATSYEMYVAQFQNADRITDRLFATHKARIGDRLAGRGFYDLFMLFMERAYSFAAEQRMIGLVLPSALYINESATGTRRMLLESISIQWFYVFSNSKELFEIHRQTKFVVFVGTKTSEPTPPFPCVFNLTDAEAMFNPDLVRLIYTRELLQATGRDHLAFLELTSAEALDVAIRCYSNHSSVSEWLREQGIALSQEVNMTYDDAVLMDASSLGIDADLRSLDGILVLSSRHSVALHEGKTFHQYTDLWSEAAINTVVDLSRPGIRANWLENCRYYRLAVRDVTNSENERTAIATILPPCLVGNTALVEVTPAKTPHSSRLLVTSLFNSFVFDWCSRLKITRHLNKFILNSLPVPALCAVSERLLIHGALRLLANHAAYNRLWLDIVGKQYLESGHSLDWPVLAGDDERWRVRAAIDAVVADAYGLSAEQYAHVLSTFSHKSYPAAPKICLAAFRELKEIGLDAFTQKYDPYWDIPLNESLPQPAIELPVPVKIEEPQSQLTLDMDTPREEVPKGAKIIDFPEAVRARQIRKAAEAPEEYNYTLEQDIGIQQPLIAEIEEEATPGFLMSPTERQVVLVARAIQLNRQKRLGSLRRTKTEKMLHVIENILDLDFDRNAEKYAAGPLDLPSYKKVMHHAEKLGAFKEQKSRSGRGYSFVPLGGLVKTADKMEQAFGALASQIDHLIEMFLSMELDDAEINATLYAVWNDLLAVGETPDDELIIDDFYLWDPAKQRFQRGHLRRNLLWIRELGLIPSGRGKIMRQKGASRKQ